MNYISRPKPLTLNNLPSVLDVIQAFLYEKAKWMVDNRTRKEPTISIIAEIVTGKIQRIYKAAGIATIRKDKIQDKVRKTYNSRLHILKTSRSKRHTILFSKKKECFESCLSKIFRVNSTKASVKPKSIRQNRNADIITNRQSLMNKKRSAALLSRQKTYIIAMEGEMYSDESPADPKLENQNDSDYEIQPSKTSNKIKQSDLSEIVEIKSRYSTSSREVSAIVNATLRLVGLEPAIDKSKIQRAQKRKYSEIQQTNIEFAGGLYYDSRKDLSIFSKTKKTENGSKIYRGTKTEEHYSLVSEPGSTFLGFVNAKDGGAEAGSSAILSFLDEKQYSEKLIALGNDGTNVNVGADGGINHFIELAVKHPLHWFVCLLHANELPLKTLIVKLDGKTSGSNSFSGPIGRELNKVCNLPIVAFKRFRSSKPLEKLPEQVYRVLSNDQKYLYNIVGALISGNFTESLKHMKIGKMNHSRWLTTASRVCRLFASTKVPSDTLKIITAYIVDVYAPTWFQIKKNELAINGPENLYFLIKRSNAITDLQARSIVQKCIQRNSFFAHSENVLLAQLVSQKKTYRIDAVEKIMKVRQRAPSSRIRLFTVPKINFQAKSWKNIAEPNNLNLMEPPFTMSMNENELLSVIASPLNVPKFKCHTQMVERAVKEVTRVSSKIINHDERNAMIKATLLSRSNFPKFDSLKDHQTKNRNAGFTKI